MTKQKCLERAAQVWCTPFCSRKEMDVDLAKGFADVLFEEVKRHNSQSEKVIKHLVSALEWCSGSADFGVDGKARKGWEAICIKALDEANSLSMAREEK